MNRAQGRTGAFFATLAIFTGVVVWYSAQSQEPATEAQPQGKPAGQPVAMPAHLTGVLITFGLKDQKATDWNGDVSVSAGKILRVDLVQGNPKAAIDGNKFTAKSVFPAKKAEKKKAGNIQHPIVRITLDAPASATVKVATKQGNFEFTLDELTMKPRLVLLDGQVAVEREEGALRLTDNEFENDYPAIAKAPDGTLWLAYCEYHPGKAYIKERVLVGNFDELVPKGNGDQVKLKKFDGKEWSAPIDVTEPGLDIWRPCVTVAEGRVHVSWAEQVDGKWDVYHRAYNLGQKKDEPRGWSEKLRVSTNPGTNFNVVSTTPADGRMWLAWQSWRDGHFQILAAGLTFADDGNKAKLLRPATQLTEGSANHWNPVIACNARGRVFVAYDAYANGNYDVRVVELSGAKTQKYDIAASARFEARPSIAVDKNNRVWIAYEEGDEQWGKDYSNNMFRKIGFSENLGYALYINRTVRVKCLENGKVFEPAGDLQHAIAERTANNRSMPRIGVDGGGNVWLLYRHHPKPLGAGEVWNSFATRYDGKNWSTPERLAMSDNLMDNRPALAPAGSGLMAVYSGDRRTKQLDRKRNDLYATILTGSGPTHPVALLPDGPPPAAKVKPVHPNEAAAVARMRDYRFEHEGKKLRLFRGEFHRHTEYTAHRDGDGLLEDSWRYALDAGNLDWMGNADHDNGHHDEYSWWQIQKMADLMHNPPAFVAVQSYERSVVYPDGHRNVILPKRGIRPLPRGTLGKRDDEKNTPDTKILYQYLKHFGGMCSSHTSGTTMGTDWRDNDPVVEPVVEVYQGHRHNYEHFGAPRSATEKTQIGGYEPKGFIWNAFDKGYKLGFQASSDHISTHISYGVVLTDDLSRQGIIDAFKRRHSYAATDNIILEFRCGKQIMGDIFDTKQPPTFNIKVLGTAPVTKVSIVRDAKYTHIEEPNKQEVTLTYTDMDSPVGKTSYYYVRIEQADGNLAWASPMWITHHAK